LFPLWRVNEEHAFLKGAFTEGVGEAGKSIETGTIQRREKQHIEASSSQEVEAKIDIK
jgi:hypothetical protein